MLRCNNYGCEAEMFQKDFDNHEQKCEFRIIRCDKCDTVNCEGKGDACIKSMASKFEHLEGKLIQVSQKL